MKIFVAGGAGHIGSVCVEKLLDAGHEVTVFDNLSEGYGGAVDVRAKFIRGDLARPDEITSAMSRTQSDAVVHLAGSSLVSESMANPSKYFRNNVTSGLHLLDAMVSSDVKKIVFFSTCAVYGVPDRLPIGEDYPVRPNNPYGQSALMFEQVLRWFEELHGILHINLRCFNAVGATEKFGEAHRNETHLLANVLAVALGQKPRVEVFGNDYGTPDGTAIRDYVHVEDLARACHVVLHFKKSATFNVGTGDGYTVLQVVEAARKVTGKKIPVVFRPRRAGDSPKLVAHAKKINREFGWEPQFPKLLESIETAWRWHQAHPLGYQKELVPVVNSKISTTIRARALDR